MNKDVIFDENNIDLLMKSAEWNYSEQCFDFCRSGIDLQIEMDKMKEEIYGYKPF
jgi:hypothetical protein